MFLHLDWKMKVKWKENVKSKEQFYFQIQCDYLQEKYSGMKLNYVMAYATQN